METASYHVLRDDDFKHVYEPSEDTFILLDALEKDLEFIKYKSPDICLEIGCGSGIVISSLAKVLGTNLAYLGTDINPFAVQATKLTSRSNNVIVEVVLSDLVNAFDPRLKNLVDLLIFNPPYVITDPEEIQGDNLQKAVAGGIKGREVMDRLFPLLPTLLSPRGIFYLVCIKGNDIDDIKCQLSNYSLEMTVVLSRRCGSEHLFVLRFIFKKS